MKLKALIFDVDGTLADTEEAHRNAFNESFRRHGLDWNWSRPRYAHLLSTAGGKERLAAHIDSLPLKPAERQALTARIAAIHATKTDIYGSMVAAGQVSLRDGVAPLIDDELTGASRVVAAGLGEGHRAHAHLASGRAVEEGRGRLFDDLLVAPLKGAIALEEVNGAAETIGKDLHLDMAW